jgi:PAS domain S-box-containing protein
MITVIGLMDCDRRIYSSTNQTGAVRPPRLHARAEIPHMKASPLQASWRTIASVLLGCIVLGLVTFVCFQLHTRFGIVALLYLLTIVVISLQGRFFVALLCSVLATLGLDYFFMQPVFSLAVTRLEDIAGLFTFSMIALAVSALGSKVRKSYWELAQENSERKRAEEELRRSEAFLAQGQRISQTGSWRWQVSTGAIYWSEEHFRIFGYDPKTDEPSYSLFFERVHGEDKAPFKEVLNRAVQDKSDFEVEYRIVLPDGAIKFLWSVGQPRLNPAGELEYIGTVMDITERKRAEEAWRKAQAELAHVNRVVTLGQLAASITHEVNQPFGAIVNNARAGLRFLATGSENLPDVKAALSDILKGVDRVNSINVRMRALAKKVPPEITELNFTEVITDVLTLIHHELTRRKVEIELEVWRELPPVLADRVQLQQVLLNLVMNGVEAMNDIAGDRKIWIRAQPYEYNGSSAVIVSVQDSGSGLKQAEVDRLFEAFYTTKPEGLGMGLAVGRSIVEAHGGRLWLASANGPGATFQFVLPAKS